MVRIMIRITRSIGCLALTVLLGCGSSMEDPISNYEGCQRLNKALAKVCTDTEAIQWLNCDVLPGCPNGTVEGQDVETCALKIESAPSCESAKNLECTINKLDCGSVETTFTEPQGVDNACTQLLAAVGEKCSEVQDSDCDQFIQCPGGAVESADVLSCITTIEQKSTCAGALGAECTILAKYCAPAP